ncbi:hypothetical protein CJ030_MR1G014995 [Morella rubra]|uniref:Uncharacterized protein n=1 Tax=Morella rubra TaxID=262757 RepID=A0A6A1WQP6_9ROSI|nr:hypothetical protein CJ030_MR1G014995 [Morella rubra]
MAPEGLAHVDILNSTMELSKDGTVLPLNLTYEWRFTDKIVKEVFCKVKPVHLDVAIHPIGMKSRVGQMETLLHLGANDVRIVELPSSVGILFATGCSSMERLSISSISQLDGLSLTGCEKLVEIQGALSFESISFIEMVGCYNLPSEFGTSLIQPSPNSAAQRLVCLPGNEVPNWFSHSRIGFSTSFLVPPLSESQIRMLSICAVYGIKKGSNWKKKYHGNP